MAQFSFISSSSAESGELTQDIRELFEELAASLPPEHRAASGECHPSLDVLETDAHVQITVDVPGVPADAIRILFRDGVLVVVGKKAPLRAGASRTFHLVEREFGRFARAVRVNGAFDVQRAAGTLRDGELTILLPKIVERRGQAHRIPLGPDRPRP